MCEKSDILIIKFNILQLLVLANGAKIVLQNDRLLSYAISCIAISFCLNLLKNVTSYEFFPCKNTYLYIITQLYFNQIVHLYIHKLYINIFIS